MGRKLGGNQRISVCSSKVCITTAELKAMHRKVATSELTLAEVMPTKNSIATSVDLAIFKI